MITYVVNGELVHVHQIDSTATIIFTTDGNYGSFSGTEFIPPTLPTPICRECHAENLEDSYQSTRDGTVLCPTCFAQRKDKRLAKPVKEEGRTVATFKTKTDLQKVAEVCRHPLDRW
jgi:hypothetical protein